MKQLISILMIVAAQSAHGQLTDREVYDAKGGRRINDTNYVYWLPYENGKSFLLIQASNSKMSHRGELSLDFKMKSGSRICAAREGVVVRTRGDSQEGGLKDEYLSLGNHILILHSDSSIAKYWHLAFNGVLVKPGDEVKKGQVIGMSGNTGFSAFPHLHFQVVDKRGRQILTRFSTRKGIRYLRPGKWYQGFRDSL
jgi:murein DD-endopeptidase MepM/ murein hydrolase activator NlpD